MATIHDDSRVIEGSSGGWGKFPDVFDPSFKATLLKEVAQHKGKAVGDPWCLGYFVGNELSWGNETSLALATLRSPADQAATSLDPHGSPDPGSQDPLATWTSAPLAGSGDRRASPAGDGSEPGPNEGSRWGLPQTGTIVLAAALAVALAALEALGDKLPVTMQAIRPGLIETELVGRFQVLPGKPAIVLDVGHNPQAIKVLADNLADMGFFDRTHAVVGMLNDKDIEGALMPLKGKVDFWHAATLTGVRGTNSETLAAIIERAQLGGEVICHPSPAAALQVAKGRAAESDRILIFGSFHTVAGALQALQARP